MDIKETVKDDIQYAAIGNNLYKILSPEFEKKLSRFLDQYRVTQSKESTETIPLEEYNQLPYSASAKNEQWKFRRSSHQIVLNLLKNCSSMKILEIGGWNGWLTHHLSSWGHEVVSTDYFIDDVNGLSCKNHYLQQWLAIQADISNLDFFKLKFDVIIVNHCLAYAQDPIQFISQLQSILNYGGSIIVLGLTFFTNTKAKEIEISQFKKKYLDKYQFEIFLNPTKAYLDLKDKNELKTMGVALYKYPQYLFRNFLSNFISTKPAYMYGIYRP